MGIGVEEVREEPSIADFIGHHSEVVIVGNGRHELGEHYHHFAQIAEADPIDSCQLGLGKLRGEFDGPFLQHSERDVDHDALSLELFAVLTYNCGRATIVVELSHFVVQ